MEIEYCFALVRRTFREGGKVRHETLGNISYLPERAILDLKVSLNGKRMVGAAARMQILRTLPHGHLDATYAMARGLRFESRLSPASRDRDLDMALLAARICKPTSNPHGSGPGRHGALVPHDSGDFPRQTLYSCPSSDKTDCRYISDFGEVG